jgi:hypothetical protein
MLLPAAGAGLAAGATRTYFVNGWNYQVSTLTPAQNLDRDTQRAALAAQGTLVSLDGRTPAGTVVTGIPAAVVGAPFNTVNFANDGDRMNVLRAIVHARGVEVTRTAYASPIYILGAGIIPGSDLGSLVKRVA